MSVRILVGDALEKVRGLPDESVHAVVTSPPYFGLRDYGEDDQVGLEETPEAYVEKLVDLFREVRRVLRDDGTLWLNLGDSYNGVGRGTMANGLQIAARATKQRTVRGLKPKDLIGVPWRVAFALQSDGWWLRQDVVWHKPNPMPESVRDRCTKAHEYLFLLSKSERYFYDADAVAEPLAKGDAGSRKPRRSGNRKRVLGSERDRTDLHGSHLGASIPWVDRSGTRNRRSVWTIATRPYAGAHFATFPPELPEICIRASTSEGGVCSECGAPRERIVDENPDEFLGWRFPCDCGATIARAVVLDPFGGAGTTGLVADRIGRDAILFELNEDYAELAAKRIRSDAPLFVDLEVVR